jgi:hypothetical protein
MGLPTKKSIEYLTFKVWEENWKEACTNTPEKENNNFDEYIYEES